MEREVKSHMIETCESKWVFAATQSNHRTNIVLEINCQKITSLKFNYFLKN